MYSVLMGASRKDKQGRGVRHLSLSARPLGFVAFVASALALAAGASAEGVPLHLVTVLLPTDNARAKNLFQLCTAMHYSSGCIRTKPTGNNGLSNSSVQQQEILLPYPICGS